MTTAKKSVTKFLLIGTFSKDGPIKCSGLEIIQYDEAKLNSIFENGFDKIECKTEDHETPFATKQNFIFCSLKNLFKHFTLPSLHENNSTKAPNCRN